MSVFDHGYLYGDGVFEGTRAYNGRIFKLKEHLERLYDSANHILLDIPLPMEEMKEVTLEAVRRNNLRDSYIRTVVSAAGRPGTDPAMPAANVVIIADKISIYPQECYERGLDVITAVTRQRRRIHLNRVEITQLPEQYSR